MIVNEQEAHSRAMYWELKRRAPPGVPVHQQSPIQDDVWEGQSPLQEGKIKCGLLTFHIVLPYSFLHYPYVEAAIRATYQKNICNCSLDTDDAEEGDNDPGTHQHIHHHHDQHHHHHDQHHHHHQHNQSQELQDPTQNKTLNLHPLNHHHHDPQHHHHRR
uniref:Selenoprotein P N-terminal domain-containing protein n=1 Tax=Seriola lalandi dorsalis TaxID=1841481 RepID=A0A3B4Z036_SERLL